MTDERSKTDVSSDEVIRKYFDTVYKPVSYTHLDVYKRQVVGSLNVVLCPV